MIVHDTCRTSLPDFIAWHYILQPQNDDMGHSKQPRVADWQ